MDDVLFIGPNFKRRKGGITSVLCQYSSYLGKDFKFQTAAYFQNRWLNFLLLPYFIGVFVVRLILEPSIAAIHIHGSSKGSFWRKYPFFLIGKYLFGKKIIYHIHAGDYLKFYDNSSRWTRKHVGRMVKEVDALIVLSPQWKSYFQRYFGDQRIYILNNIVPKREYPEFQQSEIVHFVFLGKIGALKGIFDLLECVRINRETLEDKIKLHIGGYGEVDQLEAYIHLHNLQTLIAFEGWVSGEAKIDLLRSADVMILPSYSEGLPITLLEGMSFGMPLISCHVGGIETILINDINGTVINPGDIEQMGHAIKKYINNPGLIEREGINSYHMAQKYFPLQVFEALEKIYKEVII